MSLIYYFITQTMEQPNITVLDSKFQLICIQNSNNIDCPKKKSKVERFHVKLPSGREMFATQSLKIRMWQSFVGVVT